MEDKIIYSAISDCDCTLNVWSKNKDIIYNEFTVNGEVIGIGYFGNTEHPTHVREIHLKRDELLEVLPITENALKFELTIK